MPFTNEHAFRITDPDKYQDFRRENDKFGDGIDVIFGLNPDENGEGMKSEIQSIRFDKNKFSFDEAKKWIADHDYSPIESEEASEETSNQNSDENSVALMDKVFKNFTNSSVREFDDEEMSVVHFISTENEDRYGDIVRAEGMNDKHYSKNPVVLFGHDHNSFPIGKSLWRKTTIRDGVKGILAKTKFAKTEEGKIAYELWKDGFLNSASIGFIPKKYNLITKQDGGSDGGYDFKEWELLEYSIVTIPANAEALRLAYTKSLNAPKIHSLYEELYTKQIEEAVGDAKIEIKNIEEKLSLIESQNLQFQDCIKDLTIRLENLENKKLKEVAEITANPLTDDLAKSLVENAIRGVISNGK